MSRSSLRNTKDPQHWRERAAQMRALSLTMKDPEVVTLMRDLANDYDKLADRAAAKIGWKVPIAKWGPVKGR
jgi:hypothetical protein